MLPSRASESGPAKKDERELPPERMEFFSPDKKLVFVVSSSDKWKTNTPRGELLEIDGQHRKLLFGRSLPHCYGARFVLLNNAGTTLLLDEFINVKSNFAVMILSRENKEVVRCTFDTVRDVLNESLAKVIDHSKHGWWISAPPKLAADGKTATVETAGRILVIDLGNGKLSMGK